VWLYGLAIKSLGGVEAVLLGVKPLHILVEGHGHVYADTGFVFLEANPEYQAARAAYSPTRGLRLGAVAILFLPMAQARGLQKWRD